MFAVGAGVHGLFHALTPAEARPIPSLAVLPWVFASFGVAATVSSAVASVRRGTIGRLRAIALHGGAGLLGLVGVLATDPAFPFGPVYADSLSPASERDAFYLYRGGLFCHQTVWRSEPWSPWATRDRRYEAGNCKVRGHLRWNTERQQLEVVGPGGEPLPSFGRDWSPLFDWGPH